MANGDLLRQIFRSYFMRDDTAFRLAAETIINEERNKNHRLLADDLERILINSVGRVNEKHIVSNNYDIPKDRERGFPLFEISGYVYDWERLVLPPKTLETLKQIVLEYRKRDLLALGGLKPKQKILFYGPPGCGKTIAAKVLSGVMGYPLITVRFDAIVSSLLGETASNLRRVFDFIQRGQWVVLFDEFDAIGKDRDNPFEHGELKRVVNTLLQLMDSYRGESLMLAATNHEGLLDTAVWRRFESVIPFVLPKEQDRILMLRNFLKAFDTSEINFNNIAREIKGASGSDIELFTIECAKLALLDSRKRIGQDDVRIALASFKEKAEVVNKSASTKINGILTTEDNKTLD